MKRIAQEIYPAAPPLAVSGLTFLGISLQDWVYLVTFFYTVLLIVRILPKVWGQIRTALEGGGNG